MMVSAKKLIQGSVIYMKKMRVSKRGFTLTEIIIVVAIMVIVASAAFVGVAVTLENARKNSDEVNRRHGVGEDGKDLFEAEAWEEIDELTKDAARFFDVTSYKPAKATNTPTPSPTPTTAPASDNPGGSTNTPTPQHTNTPTPQHTNTPTTQATATPEPTKATGGVTVGNVTVPKYVTGDWDKGVVQITGTGNTQTIRLQQDKWNQDDFKITKNKDNSYTLEVPHTDRRYWMDGSKFPALDKTFSYTLNDTQKAYLRDTWGIPLS